MPEVAEEDLPELISRLGQVSKWEVVRLSHGLLNLHCLTTLCREEWRKQVLHHALLTSPLIGHLPPVPHPQGMKHPQCIVPMNAWHPVQARGPTSGKQGTTENADTRD
jgi:hypothetical protein